MTICLMHCSKNNMDLEFSAGYDSRITVVKYAHNQQNDK